MYLDETHSRVIEDRKLSRHEQKMAIQKKFLLYIPMSFLLFIFVIWFFAISKISEDS